MPATGCLRFSVPARHEESRQPPAAKSLCRANQGERTRTQAHALPTLPAMFRPRVA